MTVSSLSNFTVPLASDQSATNQGLLMPKLQYRFRVSFQNFGVTSPTTTLTIQVADCTLPKVEFEDINIHVYNSQVRLQGKHSWGDISIKLRDDAIGSVQQLVGEQMQKQFDFYEQSSAASGQDYKFTLMIELLDGGNGAYTPAVLSTWQVYGAYIKDVNWGALDYKSSEPIEIELAIRFDNAIQTPLGTGIGTAVGRTIGTLATGG